MLRKRFNRIVSLLLMLAMLLTSVSVFAEDVAEDIVAGDVVAEDTTDATEVTEDTSEEASTEAPRIIGSLDYEEEGDKLFLYVATNGDDHNPGTIDKPLASITGARDKIREIKKTDGLPEGGIVVYFREGTYSIKEGVHFTGEDSGTESARITYRNYPDEVVDFVGAASLSWDDFTPVTDQAVLNRIVDKDAREHIYSVNLKKLGFTDLQPPVWPGPYSYDGGLMKHLTKKYGITKPENDTSELIINGKTMTIARYPNDGFMTITEVIEEGWDPGSLMTTEEQIMPDDTEPIEVVVADKRIQNWTNAKGAIMAGTFCYTWASQATEVGSINVKENAIKAKYPIWYKAVNGQNFYVFNLIEEIDMPGEYYIDVDKGILYIYEPAEPVEEVAYTVLNDTMFIFDADYITFKNLNMKYTKKAAFIYTNETEGCELIGSEISYAGYYNYLMGKNNTIYDCYVHDNGYGIELAGGDRATLTRSNNLLENSVFERNDRVSSTYSPSVAVTRCGNTVRHCDISGAAHTLILYSGNFQELSYCDISEACTHADDMGAIYAGRDITQRGNKILYNYIHDIGGGSGVGANGNHGIFLDDWWSAADIAGNVFANIPDGAAVMLAGSYNVMDNNIVVDCKESFRMTRSFDYGNGTSMDVLTEKAKTIPYTSEVWKNAFPGIENLIDEKGYPDVNNHIVCTNNVLLNSGLPTTSEQVAATATVENNVTFKKDPGFYDINNKNYLLKEDSEVFDRIEGFKPIPFTRIGTYSDRAIQRIKEATVFCTDSAYIFKNGEKIKSDKTEAIIENGTMYVPLRTGADAVGAKVAFDEATNLVTVTTGADTMEFTSNGSVEALKANGADYTLSKPIINKNYTNYIAIEDLVNIFNKHLVTEGKIAVISDTQELFRKSSDSGLLRYIESQLDIY